MAEVIFLFKSKPVIIQCQTNDTFEEIINCFGTKTGLITNSLIFIYNAEKIKPFLTFEQTAILDDKENKKMKVLVFSLEQKEEFINNYPEKPKQDLEERIKFLENNLKELEKNTSEIKFLMEENNHIKKRLVDLEQKYNLNNSEFKKGMIIAWYGNSKEVPDGWVICDGSKGTPDLRNRFIIGASDNIQFNSSGGKSNIKLSKSNLPPIGNGCFSALSYRGKWNHSTNGFIKCQGSYSTYIRRTDNGDNWGSNWLIDLNEGMNSSPIDIMNPYYSLYFIMKL